jgi:hypothetical protein
MDLDASGTYAAVADSAVSFQNAYIKATPTNAGPQAAPAAAANPARPPLTANTQGSPDEVVLNVPFSDKDAAKALGARWNKDLKAWTVKPRFEKDYLTKFAAFL